MVEPLSLAGSAPSLNSQPSTLNREQSEHFAVDGVAPRHLTAPDSAEEAARVLAWAARERLAVGPRGGGTRLALGNVPTALDVVLSTERLSGVVEYEPADLTISVLAGTPFVEVQRVLAERNQFLPLDPPLRDRPSTINHQPSTRSTIGGVVATNASGPVRLRYGSARDLVIGTRVANALGEVARAGGKVVKNVTGFDLNKLYVGSLGTLGLLVELTFKVQPRPERAATLVASFPEVASALRAVARTMRSPVTPSALELLGPDEARALGHGLPTDGPVLIAHVAGFERPLSRSLADLTVFAREHGATTVETGTEPSINHQPSTINQGLWDALRQEPVAPADGVRLKISLPMADVAWGIGAARDAAGSNGLEERIYASPGVGILRVSLAGPVDRLTAATRSLRALAREHLGWVVVESAPLELKRQMDVFGDPGDTFTIMRRLKQQLDPAEVMNPGRFLGRL